MGATAPRPGERVPGAMFTIEDREAVQEHVLRMAQDDPRVVAGAAVGSLALGGGDRWSDLDLTFGVDDAVPIDDVLDEWTRRLVADVDAVMLFDLPSGSTIYRVFLLPGCLQVDLSFTPASDFGAAGPRFRLLFGEERPRPYAPPPDAHELFGWAVAYARDARACIERGRWWQAELCISAVRDHALALACLRRELPARFGRGFDDLPEDVLVPFGNALVGAFTRETLFSAFDAAVEGLLRESANLEGLGDLASTVGPQLRDLVSAT